MRNIRRLAVAAALLATGAAQVSAGTPPRGQPVGHTVTIQRNAYGIPRIQANNYESLGYGEGYAFGQDNPCALVQQALTLAGDRSRWFGPSAPAPQLTLGGNPVSNLDSDLYYRSVNVTGEIQRLLATPPPLGPDAQVRAVVTGYVRGYNDYLRQQGIARLPDPACRGAAWMRPITDMDVWRRAYQFATGALGGTGSFLQAIVAAAPPAPAQPAVAALPAGLPVPRGQQASYGAASNGLALGRAMTRDGSGMVLANPHGPWTGPDRFYQMQLSVPGQLDESGVTFYGLPLIMPFGHTRHLAFTATAATDTQYTIERLTLVPRDPVSYLLDGRRHTMIREQITVPVRQPGGTIGHVTHTFYRTQDGPVIAAGNTGWTTANAYVLHDAETGNLRAPNELLAMGQADSLAQLHKAMATYQGLTRLNVLAADSTGTAAYIDGSVVPHLTDAQARACMTGADWELFEQTGQAILDGSRAACRPGSDPDAIEPGIFGPAEMPTLTRADYVANSNGSPWLINPAHPLTFPPIIGATGTDQPPRERLAFDMIGQRAAGTDGLGTPGFSLPTLSSMALDDREFFADQWRDDLVRFCHAHPTLISSAGHPVDVRTACDVLARWDGSANLDSHGEVLFREFFTALLNSPASATGLPPEQQWAAVPFDPAHPLSTPSGLNTALPAVGRALADAITDVAAHHLALDTSLRAVQRVTTPDGPIPLPGCPDACYNIISPAGQNLTTAGVYPDVIGGASFLMTVELTPGGPRAQTILTYGESANPRSPHHWDQARLFSRKQWIKESFIFLPTPPMLTRSFGGSNGVWSGRHCWIGTTPGSTSSRPSKKRLI